ncbi:MAG TPA: hypothetical protein VFT29_15140 [Gemmatimonadaceae bacterium]|nr:hypothetical protein [Gemmatimonadaceae bacterium]
MKTIRFLTAALAIPFAIASAQTQLASASTSSGSPNDSAAKDTTKKDSTSLIAAISVLKPILIQHYRPADQRGLNVFEPPKTDVVAYTGFKFDIGAAFTQQFQGMQHENRAAPVIVNNANTTSLVSIGNGFNNATANLYLNAQVAPGIRVAMTSYLSARHHQESWVKDGYALIDASPIDYPLLNSIMKYTTVKMGHFEINYGDQHFRRSDNGQALFNPFVGNLIMDAFTTEIGGELYVRASGFLGMASMTGGEVKGQVTAPEKRSPSYIGKLGYDKQLTEDLRVRLTGSMYKNDQSASNTLFTGDRAGSRYYDVLENASATGNAWSAQIRPGLANRVTSFVVNPFVRYQGLEFFGYAETAKGKATTEKSFRTVRQLAGDLVYRFWNDKLFAGYRFNTVGGTVLANKADVTVNRFQTGGGWYVNPMMLIKGEYMNQKYYNFPTTDIRNGGFIKGFVVEATLAF